MKRILLSLGVLATLAGCATSGRGPASDDSPEIAAKKAADLAASNLQAGDRIVFNQESRFALGKDRLPLGGVAYPQLITCEIVVVPPRGERVQNYVPAGKVLTITSARVEQKGLPYVEIGTYRKENIAPITEGLKQRGYASSADYIGRPTVIVYSLSGSTLEASLQCKIASGSHSISLYRNEDFARLDQLTASIQRPITVGDMLEIVPRLPYYYQNQKAAVEFIPAPRATQEYRKLPINYFPPVRTFDDVPQNSI